MSAEEKLKVLEKELNDRIKNFRWKRTDDKKKAFALKIFAVMFAGAITVLLGLRVAPSVSDVFKNIALALGAIIAVLNAIEAFYDHRSLWIRRTVSLARLYDLERQLKFYVSGTDMADIDEEKLENFMDKFREILKDDLTSWLKMREGAVPLKEPLVTTKQGGGT